MPDRNNLRDELFILAYAFGAISPQTLDLLILGHVQNIMVAEACRGRCSSHGREEAVKRNAGRGQGKKWFQGQASANSHQLGPTSYLSPSHNTPSY
jgi:hypothetical protein